jgi:hypothetical protein
MTTNIPLKLYKYQSYNVQTIDNLKNGCIWFSKPTLFNDPFDCSIPYVLENMSNDEWNTLYKRVKKLWENMKDEEYKKSTAKYFLSDKPSEDFKKNYNLASELGWGEQIKDNFSQQGIACFSEKVDDLLMWSHYSDGHRGFCLEFDTSFNPFSKAVQVHYSKLLPSSLKLDGDGILVDPLVTTKYIGWSYEKEWRLFHEHGDTEYGFDDRALAGVYFGSEMPFVHTEIISLVVSGFPTKLYKMKRSETEFKVSFEEVTYTPYVNGKSKRRFLG